MADNQKKHYSYTIKELLQIKKASKKTSSTPSEESLQMIMQIYKLELTSNIEVYFKPKQQQQQQDTRVKQQQQQQQRKYRTQPQYQQQQQQQQIEEEPFDYTSVVTNKYMKYVNYMTASNKNGIMEGTASAIFGMDESGAADNFVELPLDDIVSFNEPPKPQQIHQQTFLNPFTTKEYVNGTSEPNGIFMSSKMNVSELPIIPTQYYQSNVVVNNYQSGVAVDNDGGNDDGGGGGGEYECDDDVDKFFEDDESIEQSGMGIGDSQMEFCNGFGSSKEGKFYEAASNFVTKYQTGKTSSSTMGNTLVALLQKVLPSSPTSSSYQSVVSSAPYLSSQPPKSIAPLPMYQQQQQQQLYAQRPFSSSTTTTSSSMSTITSSNHNNRNTTLNSNSTIDIYNNANGNDNYNYYNVQNNQQQQNYPNYLNKSLNCQQPLSQSQQKPQPQQPKLHQQASLQKEQDALEQILKGVPAQNEQPIKVDELSKTQNEPSFNLNEQLQELGFINPDSSSETAVLPKIPDNVDVSFIDPAIVAVAKTASSSENDNEKSDATAKGGKSKGKSVTQIKIERPISSSSLPNNTEKEQTHKKEKSGIKIQRPTNITQNGSNGNSNSNNGGNGNNGSGAVKEDKKAGSGSKRKSKKQSQGEEKEVLDENGQKRKLRIVRKSNEVKLNEVKPNEVKSGWKTLEATKPFSQILLEDSTKK